MNVILPDFICLKIIANRNPGLKYTTLITDKISNPNVHEICQKLLDRVNYIGVSIAAQLGVGGTLVYVIIGLGLLAKAMMDLSTGFTSSQASTEVLTLLPGVFTTMADAAFMIVPALGTTLAAVLSETMSNHINQVIDKWYKEQSDEPDDH